MTNNDLGSTGYTLAFSIFAIVILLAITLLGKTFATKNKKIAAGGFVLSLIILITGGLGMKHIGDTHEAARAAHLTTWANSHGVTVTSDQAHSIVDFKGSLRGASPSPVKATQHGQPVLLIWVNNHISVVKKAT